VTISVGLVGFGYWGPNLARAIAGAPGGRLAGLAEADPQRLERAARRYPDARRYADVDQLIDDPALEAVAIATPADTHFDLSRRALLAGKHVLVEKPMSRTVDEAEELVRLAQANQRILMPAHVFLYNAAVGKVRDYIESGQLGDIYYVYSQRLNLGQVRHDVNSLWNFAPHDISILGHWLGSMPQRVMARGFSYIQPGIEDVVFLTLDYPAGVGANVHISWLDPQKVRLMAVVGSEKMVIYDDTSADSRIRLVDKGVTRKLVEAERSPAQGLGEYETFAQFQLMLRAGDVLIPKLDFVEPLQVQLADFLDSIREERRPVSDAETGLQVVRVLEAAQRSLSRAGLPVDV
jgi:predicted dehydrogenase